MKTRGPEKYCTRSEEDFFPWEGMNNVPIIHILAITRNSEGSIIPLTRSKMRSTRYQLKYNIPNFDLRPS